MVSFIMYDPNGSKTSGLMDWGSTETGFLSSPRGSWSRLRHSIKRRGKHM